MGAEPGEVDQDTWERGKNGYQEEGCRESVRNDLESGEKKLGDEVWGAGEDLHSLNLRKGWQRRNTLRLKRIQLSG